LLIFSDFGLENNESIVLNNRSIVLNNRRKKNNGGSYKKEAWF